jgi:sugar lactone lactonase YvrE
MRKKVPCLIIVAFLLTIFVSACGSGPSSTAPPEYRHPASYVSYSTSRPYLMGGAVQGGTIAAKSSNAKFSNYTVSTLAGTAGSLGFTNYTGNSSVTATFNQPNDITTIDGTNFYVADYSLNGPGKIRRISIDSGVVKTTTLDCTDSDTGAVISFFRPTGITTDGKKLYVADSGNNCIRVIEFDKDPVTNTHKVITIGSISGLAGSVDSTVKSDVRFKQPIGITSDGDNLYVTDYGNATVRWIDTKNNYAVSTLAGSPGVPGSTDGTRDIARFNLPTRLTTDGKNLYVTDVTNRTIRQIDITSGTVLTIAGSPGPLGHDNGTLDNDIGLNARFNQPDGITTDGTNLYVTDWYLNIIRVIAIAAPNKVTTLNIPGNTLHTPIGITTDGSSLLVADTSILSIDHLYTYSNSIIRIK